MVEMRGLVVIYSQLFKDFAHRKMAFLEGVTPPSTLTPVDSIQVSAKVIISRLTISNLSVLLVQLSSFSYEPKGIVSRIMFLLQVFFFILIEIHPRSTILNENRGHS